MKKFLIGVLVLISFVSCDPEEWTSSHSARFYIKNLTSRVLEIYGRGNKLELALINPGDSVSIFSYGILLGYNKLPKFDDLHQNFDIIIVRDPILQDTLARHLMFFNEDDWTLYKAQKSGECFRFSWVFEILEEDIKQDESTNP